LKVGINVGKEVGVRLGFDVIGVRVGIDVTGDRLGIMVGSATFGPHKIPKVGKR